MINGCTPAIIMKKRKEGTKKKESKTMEIDPKSNCANDDD